MLSNSPLGEMLKLKYSESMARRSMSWFVTSWGTEDQGTSWSAGLSKALSRSTPMVMRERMSRGGSKRMAPKFPKSVRPSW